MSWNWSFSIASISSSKNVRNRSIEELKQFFKCDMCDGRGLSSEIVIGWMADGDIIKDRRIDKELILFKDARQLNMDCKILSKMERGCIEPDMSISY